MDGAVEVNDFPVVSAEFINDGLQESGGVGVEKGGAGVWKPFSDITEACRTQQSINNGMNEYICVAVAIQSERRVVNDDPTEDERPA
jgi:hypothetical protein